MIWLAFLLGLIGLLASALFSGLETGFYRAARIRLVLDALEGDPIARVLVWFTNHAPLFVATILVGNNLANYLVSFAIVLAAGYLTEQYAHIVETVLPLVLSPLIFVYAELLPKSLFLHAPNLLLKRAGPFFLICVPLFFPISGVLWALNRLLGRMLTEQPEQVRLTIARRELQRLLTQSHQTDVLNETQRELAQRIFAAARRPVSQCVYPLETFPTVTAPVDRKKVLDVAERSEIPVVAVAESPGTIPSYYVVVAEAAVGQANPTLTPLLELRTAEDLIGALMQLYVSGKRAAILKENDKPLGILTLDSLCAILLEAPGSRAAPPLAGPDTVNNPEESN